MPAAPPCGAPHCLLPLLLPLALLRRTRPSTCPPPSAPPLHLPDAQVLLSLKRSHLDRKIGRANIHVNAADAVKQALVLAESQRSEEVSKNV